jgi:hypothetical protein
MRLIERNRIHPRELTYIPYETWTNGIPGWRPRSPLAQYPVIWTAAGTADSVMPLTYEQLLAVTEGVAVRVR